MNDDEQWLLTFAAGGLTQTVYFATEEEARKALADPWLNQPEWPRAPRLWRRVADGAAS